jgi:hypothetical protein
MLNYDKLFTDNPNYAVIAVDKYGQVNAYTGPIFYNVPSSRWEVCNDTVQRIPMGLMPVGQDFNPKDFYVMNPNLSPEKAKEIAIGIASHPVKIKRMGVFEGTAIPIPGDMLAKDGQLLGANAAETFNDPLGLKEIQAKSDKMFKPNPMNREVITTQVMVDPQIGVGAMEPITVATQLKQQAKVLLDMAARLEGNTN